MSGDVDPDDKTEEPTEKRLHDAVERGEVAFSREAPLFASLSATLVVLIFVIPSHAEALLTALVGLIDDPAGWRIERGEDPLSDNSAEALASVLGISAGECHAAYHRARQRPAGAPS